MKLRIKGNSIRLRLAKSEVDQLEKTGMVSETVNLGPSPLVYQLSTQGDLEHPIASFSQSMLTVTLPSRWVRGWTEDERVGFEHQGPDLSILVEKDFKCLTNRPGEDESDHFPNPLEDHPC